MPPAKTRTKFSGQFAAPRGAKRRTARSDGDFGQSGAAKAANGRYFSQEQYFAGKG
jgi:hypothetical protein